MEYKTVSQEEDGRGFVRKAQCPECNRNIITGKDYFEKLTNSNLNACLCLPKKRKPSTASYKEIPEDFDTPDDEKRTRKKKPKECKQGFQRKRTTSSQGKPDDPVFDFRFLDATNNIQEHKNIGSIDSPDIHVRTTPTTIFPHIISPLTPISSEINPIVLTPGFLGEDDPMSILFDSMCANICENLEAESRAQAELHATYQEQHQHTLLPSILATHRVKTRDDDCASMRFHVDNTTRYVFILNGQPLVPEILKRPKQKKKGPMKSEAKTETTCAPIREEIKREHESNGSAAVTIQLPIPAARDSDVDDDYDSSDEEREMKKSKTKKRRSNHRKKTSRSNNSTTLLSPKSPKRNRGSTPSVVTSAEKGPPTTPLPKQFTAAAVSSMKSPASSRRSANQNVEPSSSSSSSLLVSAHTDSFGSAAVGDNVCLSSDGHFAGVFDSFLRDGVSKYISETIYPYFITKRRQYLDAEVLTKTQCTDIFKHVRQQLARPMTPIDVDTCGPESVVNRNTGCDFCCVYVNETTTKKRQYICASVGNAKAVLCRGGRAWYLSNPTDQSTFSLSDDGGRMEYSGLDMLIDLEQLSDKIKVMVNRPSLLEPLNILVVDALTPSASAEGTTSRTRDEFILLGSDGFWSHFENAQEAVDRVIDKLNVKLIPQVTLQELKEHKSEEDHKKDIIRHVFEDIILHSSPTQFDRSQRMQDAMSAVVIWLD